MISWQVMAACRGKDPELWFSEYPGDIRDAVAHCDRCPVQAECLADALERNEGFGVWGGKTTSERVQLRRKIREHRKQVA